MRYHVTRAIALAAVCGLAGVAQGANLVHHDFDANTATFAYGYTYGTGVGGGQTNSELVGGGLTGDAWQINFTMGTGPQTWAGVGGGAGKTYPATPFTAMPSQAEFSYSFAAWATGFLDTTGTTNMNVEFSLQAPDDTLSPADANTDNDTLVRFDINPLVYQRSGGWQTYSGSLATATIGAGSIANMEAYWSSIIHAQANLNFSNGIQFGQDTIADNQIRFDDIVFTHTPVPEPTSMAVIGLGAMAIMRRRR